MKKYIVLVCICLISLMLIAEENKKDPQYKLEYVNEDSTKLVKVYKMESIRVVESKSKSSFSKPVIKTIPENESPKDLQAADLLEDINGVELQTGGKDGQHISIRGFKQSQIKILVDGRPYGSGYFANLDLSTIPVSEIKEVRVIKGPVASVYGSDTMGGVINIITKSPNEKKWGNVGLILKRNATNKEYMSVSHKFDTADFWLYGSRNQRTGFMLSDDFKPTPNENGKVRNNMDSEQYDFMSKFNFELSDKLSLGFDMSSSYADEKEIPSSINDKLYRQFTDVKRFQESVFVNYIVNDYLVSDFSSYFDYNEDSYAEYKDEDLTEMYSGWPSKIKHTTLGFTHNNTYTMLNDNVFNFGLRFENQTYNRIGGSGYEDWVSNNYSYINGFLQYTHKIDDFRIIGGTGVSMFTLNDEFDFNAHFEPSISFNHSTDKTDNSISFAINTKYPSMHHLFGSTRGNEGLTEQRAKRLEYSFSYSDVLDAGNMSIPVNFSTQIFFNQIEDEIQEGMVVIDSSTTKEMYINISEYESNGFDATLKFKLFTSHTIEYSFLKLHDSPIELPIPSRNSVKVVESYEFEPIKDMKASIFGEFQYKDIVIDFDDDVVDVISPYWILNSGFNTKFKQYKFSFEVENILDTDYETRIGYPMPGINYILSMEYSF